MTRTNIVVMLMNHRLAVQAGVGVSRPRWSGHCSSSSTFHRASQCQRWDSSKTRLMLCPPCPSEDRQGRGLLPPPAPRVRLWTPAVTRVRSPSELPLQKHPVRIGKNACYQSCFQHSRASFTETSSWTHTKRPGSCNVNNSEELSFLWGRKTWYESLGSSSSSNCQRCLVSRKKSCLQGTFPFPSYSGWRPSVALQKKWLILLYRSQGGILRFIYVIPLYRCLHFGDSCLVASVNHLKVG